MDDEFVSPDKWINYMASMMGKTVEDFGISSTVIVTWSSRIAKALAESMGAAPLESWIYNWMLSSYKGSVGDSEITIVQSMIGAPGTITQMEELIACGADTVIGFGIAGSLQSTSPVGSLVVPEECIREEGTSHHYLPEDVRVTCDREIRDIFRSVAEELQVEVSFGPHWTIDAPYRELRSKVQDYAQQGVLAVEMETSAMYALAQFREIRACNLLVISDELWKEWKPAFGTPELKEGIDDGIDFLVEALKRVVQGRAT